jgi:hypothetical protein
MSDVPEGEGSLLGLWTWRLRRLQRPTDQGVPPQTLRSGSGAKGARKPAKAKKVQATRITPAGQR